MATVALAMIVKDEAGSIRATLESAKPFIDRWIVCDTGSTDGTQEIVREAMRGVPGHLFEEPFVDYAHNRNRVLEECAAASDPADYALSLSADEVLVGGAALKKFLDDYRGDESAFLVELRTPQDAQLFPRVLRVGSAWKYEGEVHERPVNRALSTDPTEWISGVTVEWRPTDAERHLRRLETYDVPVLRRIATDASRDLSTRLRALFQLAQTHEAVAASKDRAAPGGEWLHTMFLAMSLYARRVELGGDAVEVERARFQFLTAMHQLGLYDDMEMLKRLMQLQESRLPEVHFAIAYHMGRAVNDAGQSVDPTAVYDRAVAAARIALDVVQNPTTYPVNREVLWRSHQIAAHAARAMGDAAAAEKSALAGVETGGPPQLFVEFIREEVAS